MTVSRQRSGTSEGPTVLRMLLGARLRRLREAKEVTRDQAGWEIRSSESKISRMELGRVGFKERDVDDLLTLYGLEDPAERQRLLTLARDSNTPGWWQPYSDVMPNWFQAYLGLESSASLIRTYEIQFVPGLLQTREYARAVVLLGHRKAPAEEVDRRVDLRLGRQAILTKDHPPQLWAVIDESVLCRPIGGRQAMCQQLESLLEANQLPNVHLQVVPFRVGGHAAAGGAFSILRFPDPDLPDVVYVEQLTTALYLDKRDDVERYVAAMESLCIDAETPDRTEETIRDILTTYQ